MTVERTPVEVVINGRFLSQSITGVQRYAIEMIKILDRLIDRDLTNYAGLSFVLLLPRGARMTLRLKHIGIRQVGWMRGHFWEQLELPLFSRGRPLVNFCNTGPLLKRRQLVTIHDAAVFSTPQVYSRLFRTWYRLLLPKLGKMAKAVVVPSMFTKLELIRHQVAAEPKIRIISRGHEHIFSSPSDERVLTRHDIRDRFVLAVSSISPNKNFDSLLRAINFLGNRDYEFVITGAANSKVFNLAPLPEDNRVKYLGYVSDGELRALYEHALCFVYPAIYEGFGLPPLEAMACGCPVILARSTSLPEIYGEAALYCDPYSDKDIADKISEVINNAERRETLRMKGMIFAKEHTWGKCCRDLLLVLDEVLAR